MKTRPYFPWLVILLMLSACGSQPQAKSPTQTSTVTTGIGTNTSTAIRTETPSPTPDLIRPTIDAYYEISQATEDAWRSVRPATQTAAAAFLPPSDPFTEDCHGADLISPDGNWIAIDCGFARKTLQIFTLDRSRSISISYAEIFGDVDEFTMGGLAPFHWSRDSQFLYFIRSDCCFDAVQILYGKGPLYRVSIQTGNWVQLTDSLFNYYSFSATERRMLYVNQGEGTIQVWDLRTGDIFPVDLPGGYSQAARTVWSEDGLRFACQLGYFDYDPHYGIFLVDLEANTQQLIYESNLEVMPVSWSENDILTIAKTVLLATYNDQDFYVDQYLFYDTNSSSFIENPSTP